MLKSILKKLSGAPPEEAEEVIVSLGEGVTVIPTLEEPLIPTKPEPDISEPTYALVKELCKVLNLKKIRKSYKAVEAPTLHIYEYTLDAYFGNLVWEKRLETVLRGVSPETKRKFKLTLDGHSLFTRDERQFIESSVRSKLEELVCRKNRMLRCRKERLRKELLEKLEKGGV